MTPGVVFKPSIAQDAAGIRTEPLVSVPKETGVIPDATATAEPLDDPPTIQLGSRGFRHLEKLLFCDVAPQAYGAITAVPKILAPASCSFVIARARVTFASAYPVLTPNPGICCSN